MKKMTTSRFIACWLCLCPLFCMAQDRYNDSLALVALHNATDGTSWTNTWDLTQAMDTWYGVSLNNGRVTCIDMDGVANCGGDYHNSGNNLFGNIPPEIGNLTDLEFLNLHSNQLSGGIPLELGNLNNLTFLDLGSNQLIGSIPLEIYTLTDLEVLVLYSNELSGSIPPELATLTNLTSLNLGSNQLSGEIPPELGSLSNLVELSLKFNQLSGSIPPELGNLINLYDLNLSANDLNGEIPPELGNLINLHDLNLSANDLNGEIPPELSNLNVWFFNLKSNQLSGNIPSELGSLSRVIKLELNDNQLSGSIPPELGNISSLRNLGLSNNELSGSIPPQLGNLGNLNSLELHYNQLSGNIPPELGSLSSLQTLYLRNNQLSGSIPPELGNISNLIYLYLSDNLLSDTIPSEIGNLSNLERLILFNNQLSGCYDPNLLNLCTQLDPVYNTNAYISSSNNFDTSWEIFCSIGTCDPYAPCRESDSLALVALYNSTNGPNWTNTWDLTQPMDTWYGIGVNENGCVTCIDMDGVVNCGGNVSTPGNNLTGSIPPEIGNLANLEILVLYSNQLSGSIPPELENLNNLIYLNLAVNQLSGEIPPQLGNLSNLVELNLKSNQLSGSIPWQLSNLSNLYGLNISYNQLSGSIPPQLGDMGNLGHLYLNNNQLSGNIPPELGNLSILIYMHLHDNQLSGDIPSELGNLNIYHLVLSFNQLSGNIPLELANINNLKKLDLSNNQLTGTVPDFSELLNLYDLRIYKNKFSFDDISANYAVNNDSINSFEYSPQYHGEVQSHIVELDTTLTLELSTPLPGNNNQNVSYQWKRNDDTLVAAVESIYPINNLQLSDVGKYTLHMTDPSRVLDLELISEPIYVIVPGYDLYGQPAEYEQLIIEFDNSQIEEEFRIDLSIRIPGAYPSDSCNCNRLLYLWQFPSDAAALQTLIDINGKKKAQSDDAEVDGGFNNTLGIGPISGTQGWTWTDDYYNHDDSVTVFLLDSGADVQNWNASDYLLDAAPLDSCYDTIQHRGYDYTHSMTTIIGGFVDSIGHGTFGMRAIAEGTGDYMNVVPLKIFDGDGRGTLFDFICALYHAIDHDADIINISAGYAGAPSDILEEAIATAHSKGQFIVTATGNDGINIDSFPQYPAYYAKPFYKTAYDGTDSLVHYNNVISVAATNVMDTLWQHSNYGNEAATIAAYGENMGGYSHTGEEVSYSGTSVSAYYVTRQLAAEIARDKTRSLEDIWTDFDTLYLRDCPAISELTSTGKCLDIQLKEVYGDLRVFLEGAFDVSGDTMRTDINTYLHILPGQIDSNLNDTLATQPYDVPPFDYYGTESVPSTFDNYPPEVVDWVLISARTEVAADSTVSRTAAWLLKDGRIQLLKPLFEELTTAPDSVYIVIEHRSHIGVMSPQKLPVVSNIITWDFTVQDSYTTPTSTGQTMLDNLRWGMLAGDTNNDLNGYDINGADKGFWENNNGSFGIYLPTDFNMDGDINGADKIYWLNNNGKFSGVPRY